MARIPSSFLGIIAFLLWAATTTALATRQALSAWRTLSPVPTGPIHEHSTVALSPTQLVVIGGVLQSGGVISDVYSYSIPTDKWTKLASLPVTINHANAAVVDGRVYVLGGMTGSAWAGNPKGWVYDPSVGDKWTSIEAMPASEARGSAVMGVFNKTIYLASGKTKSGGESVTTVSAFDTISGKWIPLPAAAKNIPEGRDHGGGGVIGRRFYQIGGSLGAITNRKDTVFVLDLEDLSKGWTTAKGRMPTPRRGFATGVIGTRFYTFGGEGNPDKSSNGVYKEIEVYDTATDSWEQLGDMKIPRHGSYSVAVNGSVYIPGGGTASGLPATAAFDVFTPAS
ncbi:galactose oxidase [Rhypophila sp. PSN 637]